MSRYFNRMAIRTGIRPAGKQGRSTAMLTDKQALAPHFPENPAHHGIEVHEERVTAAPMQRSDMPEATQPALRPPTPENNAQTTTDLSMPAPPPNPTNGPEMGLPQAEAPVSIEHHLILENSAPAPRQPPGMTPPQDATAPQTIPKAVQNPISAQHATEKPETRSAHTSQAAQDKQRDHSIHSGEPTADLARRVEQQGLQTAIEGSETAYDALGQAAQSADPTPTNVALHDVDEGRMTASQVEMERHQSTLKQAVSGHEDPTSPFVTTPTVKQPAASKTDPPESNKIEIKIGKINLEIHQAAPAPAPTVPRPALRQQTAASQGHHLSRYYLKGF